jgi:hypothetical protein
MAALTRVGFTEVNGYRAYIMDHDGHIERRVDLVR